MESLLWITFLLLARVSAAQQAPEADEQMLADPEGWYMSNLISAAARIQSDPQMKAEWIQKTQDVSADEFVFGPPTFNCDVSTARKQKATTVHELGPSDVNVMAAMGDSVTQGLGVGAENILEVFEGNRGESWSIGGQHTLDNGVITLANVMRKFNTELKGYSTCNSARLSRLAWLNVAMGGAISWNMPSQADEIVEICQTDGHIDMANDWKVVTLLIGGNDLCRSCENELLNATYYAANIEEALDTLHAGLPRTLVNLVPMFDITPLKNFSSGLICPFIQPAFCPCGILDENRPYVRDTQLQFYDYLNEIIDTGKYDTKDDFTVVMQPMFVDLVPPLDPDTGFYDKTFLSYDCFHPSRKAHQAFAYALWNTMFIPVSTKPLDWDPYEEDPTFTCPTEEQPYFATTQNMKQVDKQKRLNRSKHIHRG